MNSLYGTRRSRPALALAGVLATILAANPAASLEVPYLAGRVTDLAEILSAEAEVRLDGRLERLEAAEGAQLAVLTLPSLEGENLEDYSIRVVETWKLGRADADDGALLLIARDDRKMRLEVGYGLESILTDAYSRRILDEIVRPRFRTGDFDGGVERAIEAVSSLIEGNDVLPAVAEARPGSARERPGRTGAFIFFVLLVVPFTLGAVTSPGCGGWLFYFFLMPLWFGFPAVLVSPRAGVFCLVAWIIAFPFLRAVLPRTRRGARWSSGGPFFGGGGWSSSGGWGGGSSGGGFSGGGGSFGGGGSSGSW